MVCIKDDKFRAASRCVLGLLTGLPGVARHHTRQRSGVELTLPVNVPALEPRQSRFLVPSTVNRAQTDRNRGAANCWPGMGVANNRTYSATRSMPFTHPKPACSRPRTRGRAPTYSAPADLEGGLVMFIFTAAHDLPVRQPVRFPESKL